MAHSLSRYERPWRLSAAHETGNLVRVKCGYCRGRGRVYYPIDLVRLIGDVPTIRVRDYIKCEKCGHRDYITTDTFKPSAAERQAMKVRRLVEVKVRKVPVWRED